MEYYIWHDGMIIECITMMSDRDVIKYTNASYDRTLKITDDNDKIIQKAK